MQDAVHVNCKMQGDTCRVICVQLHSMSSTLRWHFSAANDPAPAFARAGVQMAAAHNDAQPTLRLFVPILHFGIVPAPICLKSNQVWFTARWQGSTWTTWHLLGQPPGVKFWAQGTNFIHRPPEILYTGQQNIFWTGHHKFYKHRTRSKLAFTPHLFLCLLRARRQHPQKIEMIQQSYHLHLFCSRRMLWMIWGKCYGNHKPASQKGELSSNHLLHRSNPPAAKVQKSGSLWFFTF